MKNFLKMVTTLTVLVAMLFVTSCSGKQKKSKNNEITFWTFQELHSDFMKDAAESWNAQNPDEQIDLKISVLSYDDMHNKLLIALQSGTGAPDISDIEIGKFANYTKGKNPGLVPLNDVIEPEKDKFIIGRFDSYKKGDNYYGIDYHVGAAVIYYNKEMLDSAGINADDIVTWDDYYEAGKKFVEKTGIPFCTVESTEHWSYYPLIAQQGGDFLDASGNGVLNSEVNVKTLEYIKKLVDEGIAAIAPGGFHHSEEYWASMNNGGAASVWMPLWYMGRFTAYMPKLSGKMIIRPLPAWEKGGARSAGMGGTGTAVTVQSKNVDLAKRFLLYAKGSKEGSIKTWTKLGFDPIRWDVWTDPAMKASNEYTAYFGDGIFDMLLNIKDEILGINVGEKFPLAQTIVQKNVMFKVLGEKSMTPRDALNEANKQLNSAN